MYLFRIGVVLLLGHLNLMGQCYWQQSVDYKMEIDFDVETHQYDGESEINYVNNSPDTLENVFFHLFFNAFQPGSMMDVRSRTLPDPDRRVGARIVSLDPDQQGYQRIKSLKMNGISCVFEHVGTILEVRLPKAILPGEEVRFDMVFEAQVPVQIRRSGRDNAEGISYSMSQWYPKMCEYDHQGWHANPYIAREFYGVWGDFDVRINIDGKFTVAAGAVLQNKEDIGHGYAPETRKTKRARKKKKLEWHFIAENVHDFMWAADPDYTHLVKETDQGTELHYFYDPGTATTSNWEALHSAMNEAEAFMNAHYGKYPYPVYAFIQGGDGGMEYPMGTLITGKRSYSSLVGVGIHEWMHSWYQMVLGTNESLYPWMDEGFTSYASAEVKNHLRSKELIPGKPVDNPWKSSLLSLARFVTTGFEEPLGTHSDHFMTNSAYSEAAYTKGAVFLAQLKHIVGKQDFDQALLNYFNIWKFKHPDPNDFIRVYEKQSGLELDWYKEYMMYTVKSIDYAVDTVYTDSLGGSFVELINPGSMPMPQDLKITLKTGEELYYTIPLRIMRGVKQKDVFEFEVLDDWPWTHPVYSIKLPYDIENLESIQLDPLLRTADINIGNNTWNAE